MKELIAEHCEYDTAVYVEKAKYSGYAEDHAWYVAHMAAVMAFVHGSSSPRALDSISNSSAHCQHVLSMFPPPIDIRAKAAEDALQEHGDGLHQTDHQLPQGHQSVVQDRHLLKHLVVQVLQEGDPPARLQRRHHDPEDVRRRQAPVVFSRSHSSRA
eukprot:Sspe_Gene.26924::Locus_11378_Transcript_1_1_Confidence_1.000_Length_471::g.26924::m.26924